MPPIRSTEVEKRIDRRVGAALKARRLNLGWSQRHVAEQLGIAQQQIQKYENGSNRATLGRVVRLCALLEEDPIELITRAIGSDAPLSGGKRLMTLKASRFLMNRTPNFRQALSDLLVVTAREFGKKES